MRVQAILDNVPKEREERWLGVMQNKSDAVRDGFRCKRGMESKDVASSVCTASEESRMFLERLSNTNECPDRRARSAMLRTCSLESGMSSFENSGVLRCAYNACKIDERSLSCFFSASYLVKGCSFVSWMTHLERWSLEIWVLSVDDRSRSEACIEEEEGV